MILSGGAPAPRALVLEVRIPGGRAELAGHFADPSLSDDEHAEAFRKHMAAAGFDGAVAVAKSTAARLHLVLMRRDG